MCNEVYVIRFGREVSAGNIGELRAAIGVEPKLLKSCRNMPQIDDMDRLCLCCVDMRKTARRAGMRVRSLGNMEYEMASL